jgi:hypothetical protein
MSTNSHPAPRPYHPKTFQERGVAVPFTTPLLAGTRVRMARIGSVELIVPDPAGGRGVCVMPWTAIASRCRLTLHDKVLSTRIGLLKPITPPTVRAVARSVAAEGFAGEAALESARAAARADAGDRRVALHRLLSSFVRQMHVDPRLASSVPGVDSPDLGPKAHQTIALFAQSLGVAADLAAHALDALADTMALVGVTAGDPARLPYVTAMLRETCEEIEEWSRAQSERDRVSYARVICAAGDFTLTVVDATLAKARRRTGDMIGLLHACTTGPDPVAVAAARTEWLLDGWEQVCLIWRYARDRAARRAALIEIACYLPALPREVSEWDGRGFAREDILFARRMITLNEDSLDGAVVFDLIARNEQLRAAAR